MIRRLPRVIARLSQAAHLFISRYANTSPLLVHTRNATQDTDEDSGTSSSAAGPALEGSGTVGTEGGNTGEESASQEPSDCSAPSEAGSSAGSSDVEESDSDEDSLGLGDGLDPDDHDFALNESDVVDSD